MKSTLFTCARLRGNTDLVDILVEDGTFKEIGPNLISRVDNINIVNLEGRLILPPYVEPHIHLDYVYTARDPEAANKSGTLFEGIQRWSETKLKRTKEDIIGRARIAVKKQILNGVQFIRSSTMDCKGVATTLLLPITGMFPALIPYVTMQSEIQVVGIGLAITIVSLILIKIFFWGKSTSKVKA